MHILSSSYNGPLASNVKRWATQPQLGWRLPSNYPSRIVRTWRGYIR